VNLIRFILLLGLLSVGVAAGACQRAPLPAQPKVTPTAAVAAFNLGASSSTASLLEAVRYEVERQTGLGALSYFVGNSAVIYEELDSGRLDGILVHYVPTGDYWFSPVALDGLVVVLHGENAITDLTRVQLQALFSGRVNNWSELGGPNMEVVLVTRERGSGARQVFLQRIMAEQPIAIQALVRAGDEALLETVASTPGAVGYSTMGSADNVAVPSIDGISPSPATTADQAYPLTVPVYFVSKAEPVGALRVFLAWLQSTEAQSIIGEKYGRVR
jgi:hypothetical protein